MDQIDSTQSGAFDERGVRILCRYPAETPADGFPAGDAGRFPAFVPEASEIAYEERKFRGGKVGPKLPDKGGKLSSVGRRLGMRAMLSIWCASVTVRVASPRCWAAITTA